MKKMQQKKNKPKSKHVLYDVVYGAHAIIECLKAKKRKLVSLYTTKPLPKAYERIQPYLPKTIPNIQYVERNILSSMAKSPEHMGVVALVSPFHSRKKAFDPVKEPFLVVLDGIQDVGNLGSILRSAYCSGVDGVILSSKGSAPMTAAVFKTSAGLAEHLEIMITSSLKTTLHDLSVAG
jgi:23S rRNA (guanosine2251-2'-O)-methyltransferase